MNWIIIYSYTIIIKFTINLFPGTTPLFYAAQENHLEVLQILIAANANVNTARHNGKRNLS